MQGVSLLFPDIFWNRLKPPIIVKRKMWVYRMDVCIWIWIDTKKMFFLWLMLVYYIRSFAVLQHKWFVTTCSAAPTRGACYANFCQHSLVKRIGLLAVTELCYTVFRTNKIKCWSALKLALILCICLTFLIWNML